MLETFIEEVRTGKREGSVVTNHTTGSLSADEKEAWRQLRKELESVGITPALFDQHHDLIIATEALRYLRDRGSAQAEQPIYERLVRWNAKWRDHASELAFSGRPGLNNFERSFGMELAQALVHGHGWLANEARIRQILALTLEPNAQGDLTAALDQINTKPVQIYFMGLGSMFLVAQYQLNSVDDLKSKLSQYPRGTAFAWSDHRSPTYEILDRTVSNEIAHWSSARGMHIDGL